ncbi:U-box domain-containing protein [Musa troglodytarum]|uniref:U-box domain-containing protein n=1 Tax=Musa troglodytarum TaxID=320322 RepID=A0A9E7JYN3_9LILI|nr:U-box domain-containing protein [Musa troglodytarum]
MPQFQQPACWRLEAGGQVMDVDTAVKDGILGGGAVISGLLDSKDGTLGTDKKHDLKEMIEEMDSAAEADDVPIVFICPISMEPMVDPVTLCTGQTYERVNILRWFSTGRLTCPTTMQDLWDDTVTPNRTLHQLIHAWFSQRYLRMMKRSEDVEGRARELVQCLKKVKGEARVQTLKELHKIVAAHPSVEKPVIDSGVLGILSSLLGPFTSHAVGSEVIAVLVNLSLDSEAMTDLMQPAKISLVVDMLNEGTTKTKRKCARLIEVLMGAESFRFEIVSSLSLLVGLLRMVKDKRDPDGVSAGLSLLKTICSHDQIRSSIVSIRAVAQLVERLPDLSPNSLESALQILDDLAAIPDGRSALKDCPQTIPNTVRPLMKVSEACTRHALSILWAVCKLAPEEFVSLAVEAGLATRLLLVIQSDCPPELKKQASDLLKLCSLNYTATLFISKCKLTRTMQ